MSRSLWRSRYLAALAQLQDRISQPPVPVMAAGFTSNVDLAVPLNSAALARLLDGLDQPEEILRHGRPADPAQLMAAVLEVMAAGEGFDFPIDAPTHEWLLHRVDGEFRLGGNGAIAANATSVLGLPSLVHLTNRSTDQIAAFDRPESIRTAAEDGIRPLSDVADPASPAPIHVVLEYPAGLGLAIAGRTFATPATNRVIITHDPVNANVRVDPAFVDAVAKPATNVGRVLLSGYTQVASRAVLERLVAETLAAVELWRRTLPEIAIHLELGAMPDPADLAFLIETLGPKIDSIGLNVEELRDLAGHWSLPVSKDASDFARILDLITAKGMVHRAVVHAASFALSLTGRDPEAERAALLVAAAVGSTRAACGRYPSVADLEATALSCDPHPEGIWLLRELEAPEGIVRYADCWLVAVPTLFVDEPAVNVGLGDCFTAGLLAMS